MCVRAWGTSAHTQIHTLVHRCRSSVCTNNQSTQERVKTETSVRRERVRGRGGGRWDGPPEPNWRILLHRSKQTGGQRGRTGGADDAHTEETHLRRAGARADTQRHAHKPTHQHSGKHGELLSGPTTEPQPGSGEAEASFYAWASLRPLGWGGTSGLVSDPKCWAATSWGGGLSWFQGGTRTKSVMAGAEKEKITVGRLERRVPPVVDSDFRGLQEMIGISDVFI